MTDDDLQSVFGATLSEFSFDRNSIFKLAFIQWNGEKLLSRPDRITAHVWLVIPKPLVFRLASIRPVLQNATIEKNENGVLSSWTFENDEHLLVESKSITHFFLPILDR